MRVYQFRHLGFFTSYFFFCQCFTRRFAFALKAHLFLQSGFKILGFNIQVLGLSSSLQPSDHFLLQCSALGEPQKLRIIYGNFSFGKTIE